MKPHLKLEHRYLIFEAVFEAISATVDAVLAALRQSAAFEAISKSGLSHAALPWVDSVEVGLADYQQSLIDQGPLIKY